MNTTAEEKFIYIDKPAGWTSFDVVAYLRRAYKQKNPAEKNPRVGHAGTLDPFATGLLIVGLGRAATKRLDEFKKLKKTYLAGLHLGQTSDTGDPEGKISDAPTPAKSPTEKEIKIVLKKFLGKQLQTPPMYSAKKINGQKLYDLARAGKTVERVPAQIEIYDIKIIRYAWPILEIEVTCSAGTYIRTLAEDLGRALGCGAYCETLRRLAIGDITVSEAKTPQEILL